MSITAVVSGPLAGQAPLLKQFERAGFNVDEQPSSDPSHGIPSKPTEGWITVIVDGVDDLAPILDTNGKWTLRQHWNTPDCRACLGQGTRNGEDCSHCGGAGATNTFFHPPDPKAEAIAELLKRVEALEAR
jgi:hypothetical protein